MSGNTHITDCQVEQAAQRMRKIIDAAENSNQAGEDALIRADAAPELLQMLKQARDCIAYCRKNHPDAQKGDGAPIEVFIDDAIAKAEGHHQ